MVCGLPAPVDDLGQPLLPGDGGGEQVEEIALGQVMTAAAGDQQAAGPDSAPGQPVELLIGLDRLGQVLAGFDERRRVCHDHVVERLIAGEELEDIRPDGLGSLRRKRVGNQALFEQLQGLAVLVDKVTCPAPSRSARSPHPPE